MRDDMPQLNREFQRADSPSVGNVPKALVAVVLVALLVGIFVALSVPDVGPLGPEIARSRHGHQKRPRARESTPPEKAEPDGAVPPPRSSVRCVGRVVDSERRPVLQASVRMAGGAGDHEVTTDSLGVYELDALPQQGRVVRFVARTADGRQGAAQLALSGGGTRQIPVIVLGRASRVLVRVVCARVPVAGARVLVRDRYGTVTDAVTTSGDGVANFDLFESEQVTVTAFAPGKGRGSLPAFTPIRTQGPFTLELTGRSVRVHVVRDDDATAAPGVTVRAGHARDPGETGPIGDYVDPDAVGTTDGAGLCVIDDLPEDETVLLRAWSASGFGSVLAPPGTADATLRLAGARTTRWRISSEGTVPEDGQLLPMRLREIQAHLAPPVSFRVEDGELVASSAPGRIDAYVVAADGSVAVVQGTDGNPDPPEVVFLPMTEIAVSLVRPDGAPVPCAAVRADARDRTQSEAATDGTGAALLRAPYQDESAAIYVRCEGGLSAGGWRYLGSVQLCSRTACAEFVLDEPRVIRVRVTVDGEPSLPGDLTLYPPPGLAGVEESPERGLVTYAIHLPAGQEHLTLSASAAGFVSARRVLDMETVGREIDWDARLSTAGTLAARVVSSSRTDPVMLRIESWSAAEQQWRPSGAGNLRHGVRESPVPDETGRVEFAGLPAGRYRLKDSWSGTTSVPVEVRAGATSREVLLDVRAGDEITGQVEVPSGCSLESVSVRMTTTVGDMIEARAGEIRAGLALARDGTFRVRVPPGKPVTLSVADSTLIPDPELGAIEITPPAADVRLRLVMGSRLLLPLPTQLEATSARVSFLTVGSPRRTVATEQAGVEGDVLVVGHFPEGRYTLFVDVPGFAPAWIEDRDLVPGGAVLPGLTLEQGATISLVTESGVPLRGPVIVEARSREAPEYVRWASIAPSHVAVLSGLGRGEFEVTITRLDSSSDRVVSLRVRVNSKSMDVTVKR